MPVRSQAAVRVVRVAATPVAPARRVARAVVTPVTPAVRAVRAAVTQAVQATPVVQVAQAAVVTPVAAVVAPAVIPVAEDALPEVAEQAVLADKQEKRIRWPNGHLIYFCARPRALVGREHMLGV